MADLNAPCGKCKHALWRHNALGTGSCLDCNCAGWDSGTAAKADDPTPDPLAFYDTYFRLFRRLRSEGVSPDVAAEVARVLAFHTPMAPATPDPS